MENKQIFILMDCYEDNTIYKTLVFTENIKRRDIQKTIDDIKTRFYEQDFDEWCIDDVLMELSTIYDYYICDDFGILTI